MNLAAMMDNQFKVNHLTAAGDRGCFFDHAATDAESMQQESESASQAQRVQPNYDELHLRVGAGAAVFARDFRTGAKEAVEVGEHITANGEESEKDQAEDDLRDVIGIVLHRSRKLLVSGPSFLTNRATGSDQRKFLSDNFLHLLSILLIPLRNLENHDISFSKHTILRNLVAL
jgi:hypothetical protein